MNAVSPPNSAELGTGLPYLPIFLDVRRRMVLLIAGGEGTCAKLSLLRSAGARVRLVALRDDPILRRRYCGDADIELAQGPLDARHFEDAVVAVDASGDPETNRLARSFSRAAGIPLNVVDRPRQCNFIFPAILDRAPIIVAVSTGGAAPAIARLIRQRLETAIPAGFGRIAALAARFRGSVAERLSLHGRCAFFWERLFDGPAADLALAGRLEDAALLAESLMADLEAGPNISDVQMVDVSSEDPELLTLRAARLLRTADLIIHDPSIGPCILALGRRDARKIALDAPGVSPAALDRIKARHSRNCNLAVYLRLRPL